MFVVVCGKIALKLYITTLSHAVCSLFYWGDGGFPTKNVTQPTELKPFLFLYWSQLQVQHWCRTFLFFWHSPKLFVASCIVQFNNKTWSNAMFSNVTSIQYRLFLWHQLKKESRTIRLFIRRSFILHESTGKCFRYIGYWKALNKKWKGKWRGVKNEGYFG